MVRGILISVFFISSINLQSQTRIFPSSRAQIETPIAINPTNTNNLIGAAITEVNSSFFKMELDIQGYRTIENFYYLYIHSINKINF